MAHTPTIYIVVSDQNRNGKTLLARLLTDFLLLDGHDPFLIDTDAPEGPLRAYFPGRTVLADLASIKGQMKAFDTIIASPGRDYVIDIPARHRENFFAAERDLGFFKEARNVGFRLFVLFVVDNSFMSLKAARDTQRWPNVDLFIPVRNLFVRTTWPDAEGSLTIPFMPAPLASAISNRRFSLRAFVQGDPQNLAENLVQPLQDFLYEVLSTLSNLEPAFSLRGMSP